MDNRKIYIKICFNGIFCNSTTCCTLMTTD